MDGSDIYQVAKKAKTDSDGDTSSAKKKRIVSISPQLRDEYEPENFQRKAFEIPEPDANFDPTAEPQDGDEYLMHMNHERKQHPAVMVRKPKVSPEEPVVCAEPGETVNNENLQVVALMRPSNEWKEQQKQGFEDIRIQISVIRQQFAQHKCADQLEPVLTKDVQEWKNYCQNHKPLLSRVLRLGQRTLEQLIKKISEWLEEEEENQRDEQNTTTDEQNTSTEFQNVSADEQMPSTSATAADDDNKPSGSGAKPFAPCHPDLSKNYYWLGNWLYAAMACVTVPLEPDLHSNLRKIARSFIRMRARLQEDEVRKAIQYNLFIFLISNVFRQLDFENEV